MRVFKFAKDAVLNDLYKKDEELRINIDDEIIDNKGRWLFDVGSPLALEYGIIVNKRGVNNDITKYNT